MLLDPNPPLFPSDAAVAWGEDRYGLWQAIELNGVRQVMRWILPGRFLMGSPTEEPERFDDESQHPVILSRGFWLAETACSQALWQVVMGENPSSFTDDPAHPVNNVSWNDCRAFIDEANGLLPADVSLRLPTEAEWEYACRAGSRHAFSWGDSLNTDRANYDGNDPYNEGEKGEYRGRVVPVLSFQPNDWGLYQMHGNVWEWCEDRSAPYLDALVKDPKGPDEGRGCVLRGGSWGLGGLLRSGRRYTCAPHLRLRSVGLRLAGG